MKSARAINPYHALASALYRHYTYDTPPGESPRSHARDFPSPNNYLHRPSVWPAVERSGLPCRLLIALILDHYEAIKILGREPRGLLAASGTLAPYI